MQPNPVDLVALLEAEIEIYQGLLKLALEKQKVLVDGDIDRLEKITAAEDFLLRKAMALSRQREERQEGRGTEEAISPREAKARAQLLEVGQELRRVNELNGAMIDRFLGYINFSLALSLRGTGSGGYGNTGGVLPGPAGKRYNRVV